MYGFTEAKKNKKRAIEHNKHKHNKFIISRLANFKNIYFSGFEPKKSRPN